MKKLIRYLMLLLLMTALTNKSVLADEEGDRAALRKIRVAYEDAINSGDIDKFAPHLSKSFSIVFASGYETKSVDEIKLFWKKVRQDIGPGGRFEGALEPEKTYIFGDTAVSHGHANETIHTPEGKVIHLHPTWTVVSRKEDGEWKVLRAQSTLNPFSNELIDAEANRMKLSFGMGGLIVGFLLGFFVYAIWRRSTL